MRPFRFSSPSDLDEALDALAEPGTRVLAGGTDLLNLMKDDVVSADTLVNVKKLPELRSVAARGSGRRRVLEIGAGVSLEALRKAAMSFNSRALDGVVQAIDGIHSPQMLNMGTVGGDLLQRPRCWYFRGGYGLLPELNGVSMVEAGDHRYHAIFETGKARFVSPSSLAPVLMALDAKVEVVSKGNSRVISVADLFVVPTASRPKEHAIERDELLTRVMVPLDPRVTSATYEVRHRQTLDWPLATASVAWRERRGKISASRLVLGHVASVPWSADAAASMLDGITLDSTATGEASDRIAAAADQAVAESKPMPRNGYKVQLARTATKRAVLRGLGADIEGRSSALPGREGA